MPHQLGPEHTPFLWGEFTSMVEKGKWVMLPYHMARGLHQLRLISAGVKVERERQPRWLGNDDFNTNNTDNLPLGHLSVIQHGQALDFHLREILYADSMISPVYVLTAYFNNIFLPHLPHAK